MEKPERPKVAAYRRPGRPGVDQTLVEVTANRLLDQGVRPTVNRIRQEIGGSPNTIAPLLDRWWQTLGARLRSREPGALERLPGKLPLIAEAFFCEALEQARVRAKTEVSVARDAADQARAEAEARTYLMTQREKELAELVRAHARRAETLETELRSVRAFERKLLAERDALEHRVQELLEKLAKASASTMRRARKKKTPFKRPRVVQKKVAAKRARKIVAKAAKGRTAKRRSR